MSSPQFVHFARLGIAWQFQQLMIPGSRRDLPVVLARIMLLQPLTLRLWQ